MCDFSLEKNKQRDARVHESLTTRKFPSGTIGLVDEHDPNCAVCLKRGTELELSGLSGVMAQHLRGKTSARVVFDKLTTWGHKDGVRVDDGRFFRLQEIGEGVKVTILSTVGVREQVTAMAKEAEGARGRAATEPVEELASLGMSG